MPTRKDATCSGCHTRSSRRWLPLSPSSLLRKRSQLRLRTCIIPTEKSLRQVDSAKPMSRDVTCPGGHCRERFMRRTPQRDGLRSPRQPLQHLSSRRAKTRTAFGISNDNAFHLPERCELLKLQQERISHDASEDTCLLHCRHMTSLSFRNIITHPGHFDVEQCIWESGCGGGHRRLC